MFFMLIYVDTRFIISIFTGRPDQVHNCTITNISMTSLSVRCLEGFNGGIKQEFMLEVKDSQTSELRANYTSPFPRFTVNSLSPSSIYLVSIYAFNSKGRSDPSVVQATMQRMPEKPLTGEKGKMKNVVVTNKNEKNKIPSFFLRKELKKKRLYPFFCHT